MDVWGEVRGVRTSARRGAEVVVADETGDGVRDIIALLEREGHVVVETPDGVDALDMPGVRLVVLRCALTPLARPRTVMAIAPLLPVLVVATEAGPHTVRRAVSAGARGVVLADTLERTLMPTVRAIAAGLVCTPKALAESTVPHLSHREKQVLELVAEGLTNAEVADKLYLAESTVKTHLATTFRKLGVRTRSEASTLALDPDFAQLIGLRRTPALLEV